MADDSGARMAQERAQEEQATLKGIHKPMKKWYKACPELVSEFGSFPTFWQDLSSWTHYAGVQKAFRVSYDRTDSGRDPLSGAELVSIAGANHTSAPAAELAPPGAASAPVSPKDSKYSSASSAVDIKRATEQVSATREGLSSAIAPSLPATTGTEQHGSSGAGVQAGSSTHQSSAAAPQQPPRKRRRRRRWEAKERTSTRFGARVLPAHATLMPGGLTLRQQRAFLLKVRIDEVNLYLLQAPEVAVAEGDDPNRPRSPAPQYDDTGKRTNSRLQRRIKALVEEKEKLIEELIDLYPEIVGGRRLRVRIDDEHPAVAAHAAIEEASGGPGSTSGKGQLGTGARFARRVPMPPGCDEKDVMGFVLGPRGNTQKRLMRETLCNISIRGKSAHKEGRQAAPDGGAPTYALVEGSDLSAVEACADVVKRLMQMDESLQQHKEYQQMELQVYNGGLGAGAAALGRKQWELMQLERQQEASSGSQKPVDTLFLLIDVDPSKYSAEDRDYIKFMASQGDKTALALAQKAKAAGVSLDTDADDGDNDGIAAPAGASGGSGESGSASKGTGAASGQAASSSSSSSSSSFSSSSSSSSAAGGSGSAPGEAATSYLEWKKKHDAELAATAQAQRQALLEAEKMRVLAMQAEAQRREAELKAMRDRLGIPSPSPKSQAPASHGVGLSSSSSSAAAASSSAPRGDATTQAPSTAPAPVPTAAQSDSAERPASADGAGSDAAAAGEGEGTKTTDPVAAAQEAVAEQAKSLEMHLAAIQEQEMLVLQEQQRRQQKKEEEQARMRAQMHAAMEADGSTAGLAAIAKAWATAGKQPTTVKHQQQGPPGPPFHQQAGMPQARPQYTHQQAAMQPLGAAMYQQQPMQGMVAPGFYQPHSMYGGAHTHGQMQGQTMQMQGHGQAMMMMPGMGFHQQPQFHPGFHQAMYQQQQQQQQHSMGYAHFQQPEQAQAGVQLQGYPGMAGAGGYPPSAPPPPPPPPPPPGPPAGDSSG